jgi:hypothetical protein
MPEHNLAIEEILGAAETDESYFLSHKESRLAQLATRRDPAGPNVWQSKRKGDEGMGGDANMWFFYPHISSYPHISLF